MGVVKVMKEHFELRLECGADAGEVNRPGERKERLERFLNRFKSFGAI